MNGTLPILFVVASFATIRETQRRHHEHLFILIFKNHKHTALIMQLLSRYFM